jgi:hypothetical protein
MKKVGCFQPINWFISANWLISAIFSHWIFMVVFDKFGSKWTDIQIKLFQSWGIGVDVVDVVFYQRILSLSV